MADDFESSLRGVMSGEARGVKASMARAGLTLIEPFYRGATTLRNRLFDWGIRAQRRLPVPVISVGNLTTGGTGKTPLVAWMVHQLLQRGHTPAVLLRGYKKKTGLSDEEQLYRSQFANSPVRILASPKRFAIAQAALREADPPTVFVLDDGFQHRQLRRDLDLVLIDATNPFGYEHVLPRGMLRESVAGLMRADAVIITRSDQVDGKSLVSLRARIGDLHPAAPVFTCSHELLVPDAVIGKRLFAFCGIGNPQSFWHLLDLARLSVTGTKSFNDHQHYTPEMLRSLESTARAAGAELLVTTEKDWTKVEPFAPTVSLPIVSMKMHVKFAPQDEALLLAKIEQTVRGK